MRRQGCMRVSCGGLYGHRSPGGPQSSIIEGLSRCGHSATFLSFIKSKTGFSENRLKSRFFRYRCKSTDAQVSLDPVQIIIADRQDTYFSNYPTILAPLLLSLVPKSSKHVNPKIILSKVYPKINTVCLVNMEVWLSNF